MMAVEAHGVVFLAGKSISARYLLAMKLLVKLLLYVMILCLNSYKRERGLCICFQVLFILKSTTPTALLTQLRSFPIRTKLTN